MTLKKHRRVTTRKKACQCACWVCNIEGSDYRDMFRKFKRRRDALKGWDR